MENEGLFHWINEELANEGKRGGFAFVVSLDPFDEQDRPLWRESAYVSVRPSSEGMDYFDDIKFWNDNRYQMKRLEHLFDHEQFIFTWPLDYDPSRTASNFYLVRYDGDRLVRLARCYGKSDESKCTQYFFGRTCCDDRFGNVGAGALVRRRKKCSRPDRELAQTFARYPGLFRRLGKMARPKSMKMDNIASPWRYNWLAGTSIRYPNIRYHSPVRNARSGSRPCMRTVRLIAIGPIHVFAECYQS
jgi:hypothetical protein